MDDNFSKIKGCSQKDILLGGLFLIGQSTVSELRSRLKTEGVIRGNNKWNVSNVLCRANDYAILKGGKYWELTKEGQRYVEDKFGFNEKKQEISSEINSILSNLDESHPNFSYVKEFGGCFDDSYTKAALIMAWSGAIWLLRNHVFSEKLEDFNNHAQSRYPKTWKNIKKIEDFSDHKDKTFLDVCSEANIFTRAFLRKIEPILKLRNDCSHPSPIAIGEVEIMNAIEFLVLNIYKEYPSSPK